MRKEGWRYENGEDYCPSCVDKRCDQMNPDEEKERAESLLKETEKIIEERTNRMDARRQRLEEHSVGIGFPLKEMKA